MTFEDFFQGALRRGDCIEREKDAMRCAWQAARRTVSGQEALCEHEWQAMTDPHKECVKCGDVRRDWDAAPIPATELTLDEISAFAERLSRAGYSRQAEHLRRVVDVAAEEE